jgi:hypothetical protein
MLSSFTSLESEIPVVVERPKVAVSSGPLGTVSGVQFVAVFQSPLAPYVFQVALPAWESRIRAKVRVKTIITVVFMELVPFHLTDCSPVNPV